LPLKTIFFIKIFLSTQWLGWLLLLARLVFAEELLEEHPLVDFAGYPVGESYSYITSQTPRPNDLVWFTGIHSKTLALVPGMQLRRPAFDAFIALKNQAAQQGIYLHSSWGYRSYATQVKLWQRYGKQHAERPGFSEHHLGTALDFTRVQFASEAFLWLLEYAIPAGWAPTYFYRQDSQFIAEPWHWRFIGIEAAQSFYTRWQTEIQRDISRLRALQKQGKLNKNPKLARSLQGYELPLSPPDAACLISNLCDINVALITMG